MLVGINCSAGVERCRGRKGLLSRYQHLLQIFGRVPRWLGIFGTGLMSVEDINAPDRIPGAGMTCERLGLCMEPVDGEDDIV